MSRAVNGFLIFSSVLYSTKSKNEEDSKKKAFNFLLLITVLLSPPAESSLFEEWKEWGKDKYACAKQNIHKAKRYWNEEGFTGVVLKTGSTLVKAGSNAKTLLSFYNPASIYFEEDPVLRRIKTHGLLLISHMVVDGVSEGAKFIGYNEVSFFLDPLRVGMSATGAGAFAFLIKKQHNTQLRKNVKSVHKISGIHCLTDLSVLGASRILKIGTENPLYNGIGILGITTDILILKELVEIAQNIEVVKRKDS